MPSSWNGVWVSYDADLHGYDTVGEFAASIKNNVKICPDDEISLGPAADENRTPAERFTNLVRVFGTASNACNDIDSLHWSPDPVKEEELSTTCRIIQSELEQQALKLFQSPTAPYYLDVLLCGITFFTARFICSVEERHHRSISLHGLDFQVSDSTSQILKPDPDRFVWFVECLEFLGDYLNSPNGETFGKPWRTPYDDGKKPLEHRYSSLESYCNLAFVCIDYKDFFEKNPERALSVAQRWAPVSDRFEFLHSRLQYFADNYLTGSDRATVVSNLVAFDVGAETPILDEDNLLSVVELAQANERLPGEKAVALSQLSSYISKPRFWGIQSWLFSEPTLPWCLLFQNRCYSRFTFFDFFEKISSEFHEASPTDVLDLCKSFQSFAVHFKDHGELFTSASEMEKLNQVVGGTLVSIVRNDRNRWADKLTPAIKSQLEDSLIALARAWMSHISISSVSSSILQFVLAVDETLLLEVDPETLAAAFKNSESGSDVGLLRRIQPDLMEKLAPTLTLLLNDGRIGVLKYSTSTLLSAFAPIVFKIAQESEGKVIRKLLWDMTPTVEAAPDEAVKHMDFLFTRFSDFGHAMCALSKLRPDAFVPYADQLFSWIKEFQKIPTYRPKRKEPYWPQCMCNNCRKRNFYGPLYSCQMCYSFDLCPSCYHQHTSTVSKEQASAIHDAQHDFFGLTFPDVTDPKAYNEDRFYKNVLAILDHVIAGSLTFSEASISYFSELIQGTEDVKSGILIMLESLATKASLQDRVAVFIPRLLGYLTTSQKPRVIQMIQALQDSSKNADLQLILAPYVRTLIQAVRARNLSTTLTYLNNLVKTVVTIFPNHISSSNSLMESLVPVASICIDEKVIPSDIVTTLGILGGASEDLARKIIPYILRLCKEFLNSSLEDRDELAKTCLTEIRNIGNKVSSGVLTPYVEDLDALRSKYALSASTRDEIQQILDLQAGISVKSLSEKLLKMGDVWKKLGFDPNDPFLEAVNNEMAKDGAEREEYDVMLSYNWGSQATVIRIRDSLQARGFSVWMDVDLMSGNVYIKMAQAVLSSKVIIPCLTLSYEASANCKRELGFAADQVRNGKKVVPVRLEDGSFTWSALITAGLLYTFIGKPQVEEEAKWDEAIDGLSKEIDSALAELGLPRKYKPVQKAEPKADSQTLEKQLELPPAGTASITTVTVTTPVPPSPSKTTDKFDVMLSYNWGHQPIVLRMRDTLISFGFRVWMDVDLMSGNVYSKMAEAVMGSSVIVTCLTAAYEKSANCQREFQFTVEQTKIGGKKIVPVLLEDDDGKALTWTREFTDDLQCVVITKSDLQDDIKWNERMHSLSNLIQISLRGGSISTKVDAAASSTSPSTPSSSSSGRSFPSSQGLPPPRPPSIVVDERLAQRLASFEQKLNNLAQLTGVPSAGIRSNTVSGMDGSPTSNLSTQNNKPFQQPPTMFGDLASPTIPTIRMDKLEARMTMLEARMTTRMNVLETTLESVLAGQQRLEQLLVSFVAKEVEIREKIRSPMSAVSESLQYSAP
ncbi:hypothetical protein HK102_001968 [Quaeritorhiza haematococci]|nr:hypothetical protein HK102_001968 [Quaeritorhiza haematococci]